MLLNNYVDIKHSPMTNPTQEIPAEEIQRIKNDAEYMYPDGSAHNSLMNFGYQNGAKAEFIRAHQQAQGETICRFVKAIERLPSRNGDYNGRYNINRCVIDIRKGEIYELRGLPHIIPSDQVEIEYLEWLEELPAQVQYTSDSPDAEDIPIPDDIKQFIGGYLGKVIFTDNGMQEACKAMVTMYRKLTESAVKLPETMGKELHFKCNWSNKTCDEFIICMEDDENASYYTVLKGVFARLVFNKDLIDDRRVAKHEAADYRKTIESLADGMQQLFDMRKEKGSKMTMKDHWNLVSGRLFDARKILNKYPSPPTK